MVVRLTKRRFTADEYQWMGRVGILTEEDRVELIDGEIVEMAPIGEEHNAAVDWLNALFTRRFGEVAQIRVQGSVRLGPYNEPEPDLVLLRPRKDFYRHGMAAAEDILLIVEVAQTSLAYDRGVKMPMYARAGVPDVWLLNITHDVVEVRREPGPDGYRVVLTLRRGDRLAPLAFPDREFEVSELLG